MFKGCGGFTEAGINSIAGWDVGNGQTFVQMLRDTANLGALNLSSWDITSATSFNTFIAGSSNLSTANYDALLVSWAAQSFIQNAQAAGFGGSTFTGGGTATAARATLEAGKAGWNITDGGIA